MKEDFREVEINKIIADFLKHTIYPDGNFVEDEKGKVYRVYTKSLDAHPLAWSKLGGEFEPNFSKTKTGWSCGDAISTNWYSSNSSIEFSASESLAKCILDKKNSKQPSQNTLGV